MVHLIIYLVKKIRFCGLVYLRWMYLVEWYMKIFKGYMKNHYFLEALIIKRYITKEAIEFCSNYLSETNSIWIPKYRHDKKYAGKGTQGLNVKTMTWDVVLQAHFYILNDEVQPYLSAHNILIKEKFLWMSEKWMLRKNGSHK